MSDIQDLIHTQTVKAYESGVRHEQERIIKLLEEWLNDDNGDFAYTLRLIKGATNAAVKE